MNDLVETFEAMLGSEPGLPDITDEVMVAGQRLRRRRRLSAAAAVIAVAGVIAGAVAVSLAFWGGGASTRHMTLGRPGTPRDAKVLADINTDPLRATAALCSVGLRPLYVSVPPLDRADENVNGYAVKAVSPKPGSEVKAGSVVELKLSADINGAGPWVGPKPAAQLPNVTGLDINSALVKLTTLGLLVNVNPTTPTAALLVTSETPAAGTNVPGGSTVTLRIGAVGSQGCPSRF
jgi:PASTA domain